jgi:WD40 repeat protein
MKHIETPMVSEYMGKFAAVFCAALALWCLGCAGQDARSGTDDRGAKPLDAGLPVMEPVAAVVDAGPALEPDRAVFPQLGHSDYVLSVAFSPDGRRIVSGADNGIMKLWDAASGREIRSFLGHSGEVLCVTFSPDGKQIASGSWDETVKLWDAASGREIRSFAGHAS